MNEKGNIPFGVFSFCLVCDLHIPKDSGVAHFHEVFVAVGVDDDGGRNSNPSHVFHKSANHMLVGSLQFA